ncbi:zinc finger, CCHC-type, retrotransposon gag domain protein [Tanacetum coccineum]
MVNTRTDAELAAAVQAAVDAMLPQIREQVREEYRTGASGSNPPPVTIHTWLERFNKQKPRSFEKAVAPVDAENWISHMEKIFDVMDCNDAFKTRLAVYKFEGDALAWWKAYKQAKGGDAWVLTLTWAAFKELFFLQFFPRAEQERLKREYHSIRQRASENSTEYMQRFLRLAGFLGQAAGTAEEQAKNFRWGLHKSILDHVMCIQFTDVAQVADAARNLEILRDRDDYDRSERSDKSYRLSPLNKWSSGGVQSRFETYSGKDGPFTITKVFPYGTIELSQPDGLNFKVKLSDPKQALRGRHPMLIRRCPGFLKPLMLMDFVLRSQELQILSFILGIRYLNLID